MSPTQYREPQRSRLDRLADDKTIASVARIATIVISCLAVLASVPAAFAFNRLVDQLDKTTERVQKIANTQAVAAVVVDNLARRVDILEKSP